ncbi:MAG: hypothetical protein Q9227_003247 [Pyrenula ochraceoflavens]
MPPKRPHEEDSSEDDSLCGDGDSDTSECLPSPKKIPKPPPPARQKATVIELATEESRPQLSTTETEIMERIKKCLNRAKHPSTSENEAKAALHLASRFMAQYNVTQADVFAASEEVDLEKYTGHSVVSITNTQEGWRRVLKQGFTGCVASAMEVFFDCKSCYVLRISSHERIFYGVAPNTVAAAMAFEMVFNLILEWARPRKGKTEIYSYCMGVASGLLRMAEKEKEEEMERVMKQEIEELQTREQEERLQREKELEMLRGAPPTRDETAKNRPYILEITDSDLEALALPSPRSCESAGRSVNLGPCSSSRLESDIRKIRENHDDLDVDFNDNWNADDDDCDEDEYDDDEEDRNGFGDVREGLDHVENEAKDGVDESQPRWNNGMQLVQYRESAAKMADDYLKGQNIKLSSGGRSAPVRDWTSYYEGMADSERIDVRQRRIKDTE